MLGQVSSFVLIGLLCAFSNVYPFDVRAQSASGVWSSKFPTPPGANGPVQAMAVYGSDLIVVGEFTRIANVPARGLARWNGQAWSEFSGGVQKSNTYGIVYAVAVSGTNLYIAGAFQSAGGVAAHNIARWTGVNWEPLSGGLVQFSGKSAAVYALHVQGTNLFAGGSFVKAGAIEALNLARWDGSTLHALSRGAYLPSDLDTGYYSPVGRVHAITSDSTNLYVGGIFQKAGAIGATNLAKWNGAEWQSIGATHGGQEWIVEGENISGFVNGLAWAEDALYVGGGFTSVDGQSISNVARLKNGTWDAPLVIDGDFSRFAESDNDLYLLGAFTAARTNNTTFPATKYPQAPRIKLDRGQRPYAEI